MEWKDWIGKRIFVKLKGGSVYNGEVLSVDDKRSPVQFINIKDKFEKIVCFPVNEIIKIVEEVENGW